MLGNPVADRPCRVHAFDLRIYGEAAGLATFPDGAVLCAPLRQQPPSPTATALNPTVLLEVTSDPSEEYDTGTKKDCYQTIPSLQALAVVSHRERRITVHQRTDLGQWRTSVAISGGQVSVAAVGATLDVDAIYSKSRIA